MNLQEINDFIKESNAIEGIYNDIALEADHRHAFVHMLEDALDGKLPDIKHLHQTMLHGKLQHAGFYRECYVQVGSYVAPDYKLVPILMDNFMSNMRFDYLNGKFDVKRCWHYHHYFETIHPFEDGNGRAGRLLLAQLFLLHDLEMPIIYEQSKWDYYASIESWRFENTIFLIAELANAKSR